MKLLTYAQACERSGLSEPTIRKLYREGKVRGRTMLVTLFDEEAIEELRQQRFLCPKKKHPATDYNVRATERSDGRIERYCVLCQREYSKTPAAKARALRAGRKWRENKKNGKSKLP